MDNLILKILLAIVKWFYKSNIDFEKLKIIATTKVMMDRRRGLSNTMQRQKKGKEMKNPLLFTLIMYGFTGLFVGLVIMQSTSVFVSMSLMHSYLLFMMAMTLITDFSTVLLDTTDSQIILPKPVSSRTFFLARVVHILTYLLQFTIALSLFPLIFAFIKFGFFVGLVITISVILMVAFAVFLTYFLYALMLQFSSEEKIKQIVAGFQVFMTIFFAVAYQILPRMINFGEGFTFKLHWYSYILPPVWMALAVEAFQLRIFDAVHIVMICLSVIAPIGTVWIMFKYLAPTFSKKIAQLGIGTTGNNASKNLKTTASLSEKISPIVCTGSYEKAGFEKVWKMTGRDKQFKMAFYPSLAYVFIFGFIFLVNKKESFAVFWEKLPSTSMYIVFAYLPLFAAGTGLVAMNYNENFASAWIYQASPIKKPGEIISGGVKAILLKYLTPVFLVILAFSLFVWGPKILDDFMFAYLNLFFICLLLVQLSSHYLPFSREPNPKQQSGKFAKMLLQFLIIGVLIGAHFLAAKTNWLVWLLIPLISIAAWLIHRSVKNISWQKIEW